MPYILSLNRLHAHYVPVTAIGQSVGASDIGLQLTAFGGETDVPFQQAVYVPLPPTNADNMY